jgi:hypothetical protein
VGHDGQVAARRIRRGRSEIRELAEKVSPPSSEYANLAAHCRVSSAASRRSYQETPTTPEEFTATAGSKWCRPRCRSAGDWSSLMTIGADQVRPLSAEWERRISQRPERRSGQVA